MSNILNPGVAAPDFTLNVTPDQKISLSDFHGKPLIIIFYPADWSPVCGDEAGLLMLYYQNFVNMELNCLGSPQMDLGVTAHLRDIVNCIIPYCLILNRKAKWLNNTVLIATMKASVNVLFS